MSISDNLSLINQIEKKIAHALPIRLGVNKRNELVRLVYEICRRDGVLPKNVLRDIQIEDIVEQGKGGLFHRVKESVSRKRYPSMGAGEPHIMPLAMKEGREECSNWDFTLSPENIYIEKDVKGLEWTDLFLKNFPDAKKEYIGDIKEVAGIIQDNDHVSVYNSRRKNIVLVKNKETFVKICPCTKDCVRCGYWILNIGFGCPIDCSYCYLQMYSNAAGMVFPANIEEYLEHIDIFDKKQTVKTRIGTGEFTDSLAFDNYTRYSSYLIPAFKDKKNLILELKTKVADIRNVIKEEPHENAVISWSINTPGIAREYEKGASSASERIEAAELAASKGFKVGFHFDPIVCYEGWEEDYKAIISKLASSEEVKRSTAWISLGTLRYTPGLKQIAEQRFSDNNIFYYGEFYEDIDGKLRYSADMRVSMYKKVIKWLEDTGISGWIYLCMEPVSVWKEVGIEPGEWAESS